MSLPLPLCNRCQSSLPASGRCPRCVPLTSLTGIQVRSPHPSKAPDSSRSDDNWDVVLSDAPAPAATAAQPEAYDDGPGTLAFGRGADGSIRPLTQAPPAAPVVEAQAPGERHTVGFLGTLSTGAFAIPPPRILSDPPKEVSSSRSAPKVMILGATRSEAGERITPQSTLAFQRDFAPPVAPVKVEAPPRRADGGFAETLSFEGAPSSARPFLAEVSQLPPALANVVPANDAAPAPPTAAPPVAVPAPAPVTPMHTTALTGGAALLLAGLLSATTGATDTAAFLLAGGALLATTVSEMSAPQRAWSGVAVGLPLLVLEVGANPMLPALAAALAALVVAGLGGALCLRAQSPSAPLSRDALAGAVVACAAWMIAPGGGGLADPSRAPGPAAWVAPAMLPGLLVGLAALLPGVARRVGHGLVAVPALWCATLPFVQALDLARPTAPTQLLTAHALASFAAVVVTSLALAAVFEDHTAQV